jgi:hypothetical protein
MFESSLVHVFVFRIIPVLILGLVAIFLNFTSNVLTNETKKETVKNRVV